MDARSEIREFLTSRRARLKAADVGLPDHGPRRVPALRREEVAVLAGVSVPYYTRLERGDVAGVSDGVLGALARALRLDEAERAHLFDLARAVQPLAPPARRRTAKQRVRPAVQMILDAMHGVPAVLSNDRQDFLAANALARALFADLFDGQERPNSARFVFLDPRARDLYPTGSWSPATSSPHCGRPPVTVPTTAPSATSSGSCPRAAISSDSSGPAMTSVTTPAASSACITLRSATWSSATKGST